MTIKQGDTVRIPERLLTSTEFKVVSVHDKTDTLKVTCEFAGFKFRGFLPVDIVQKVEE